MARMLVRSVCTALVILGATALVAAQVQKRLVIVPVASVDGQTLYKAYCAGCHGDDGHGRGIDAPGLAVAPPDLTTVCLRHSDTPIAMHLTAEINGFERARPAPDQLVVMPAFGSIFDRIYTEPADRAVRVAALVTYVKRIQAPDTAAR